VTAPIPFNAQASTITIAVTATASTSTALPAQGSTLRLINLGSSPCYVAISSGTATAVVASSTPSTSATPILAGSDNTLTIPIGVTLNISAICATGQTTTLAVQVGEGI